MPDQDAEAYEAAMRRQRATNARQEAEAARTWKAIGPATLSGEPVVGIEGAVTHRRHPGVLESMIPIWGAQKEALADLDDHNYGGAALNTALAASDAFLGRAVVGGMLKGGLKTTGPFAWRTKRGEGMRKWLGEKGFLEKGQPGHHWGPRQASGWPDWIKNQPPFINGMRDAIDHGLVHGPYKGQPQYNLLQRFVRGTPDWWKATLASAPGHAALAADRLGNDE